ncbi:GatB/YqeY domain-containing protein [Pholiota conissans]|uniref:Altered inheritance of mitochondria protein 41 n=1 Tax=Pholiota conissans TaxID=109636 RepID=A0A9P5ZC82_9AGAR|nr:GatB/YqeY domain-containing protein [Pholiota conissans]
MLSFIRSIARANLATRRLYSTLDQPDLRTWLLNEVKNAMKIRDTHTSMTLRSVLSEINSAEKTSNGELSSSEVANVMRKAIQRRSEAAAQFGKANRPDLAKKEQEEVELLSKFLPPLLSAADIDIHINFILETLPKETDPRKISGLIFKEFYSRVDKSTVDSNLVKERAHTLLTSKS